MNCDYYDGNINEFMSCMDSRKSICQSHCKVKGEIRLKGYKKLSETADSKKNNFKDEFYKEEVRCFICGTISGESIEHIYPQCENIGDLVFRNSCPSNFRRACRVCNGQRANNWGDFITDKKKVHKVLQEYDITSDHDLVFDFEATCFRYNKKNIYSSLYLTPKKAKEFKRMYQDTYDQYQKNVGQININDICKEKMQFYCILTNTINKINGGV